MNFWNYFAESYRYHFRKSICLIDLSEICRFRFYDLRHMISPPKLPFPFVKRISFRINFEKLVILPLLWQAQSTRTAKIDPTSGPTKAPTRAPTRVPSRVTTKSLPCFSPSRTPHERPHRNVPRGCPRKCPRKLHKSGRFSHVLFSHVLFVAQLIYNDRVPENYF